MNYALSPNNGLQLGKIYSLMIPMIGKDPFFGNSFHWKKICSLMIPSIRKDPFFDDSFANNFNVEMRSIFKFILQYFMVSSICLILIFFLNGK